LREDARCARKVRLLTAPLADRPVKPRLDRRSGHVDIVAAEAKPGFQPQRVARAEPDQLHLRMAEQALGDGADADRLDRDLEAVLAGISRAADVALDAVETRAPRAHERHRGGVRRVTREYRGGARALQRDQRPMIGPQEPILRRQLEYDFIEMCC